MGRIYQGQSNLGRKEDSVTDKIDLWERFLLVISAPIRWALTPTQSDKKVTKRDSTKEVEEFEKRRIP